MAAWTDSNISFPWEAIAIPFPCMISTAILIFSGSRAWISWNLSFRYILFHEQKAPNDAVTPQLQSQFTPKMKANAVPRLLSSLVWIDQYNECNGMTGFMEFMGRCSSQRGYLCFYCRKLIICSQNQLPQLHTYCTHSMEHSCPLISDQMLST